MDVITKDVRALAKKELAAANRRFRMFASPHEGYIEVYKFDSGVVLATPEVEVKAKTDESLPPWKR